MYQFQCLCMSSGLESVLPQFSNIKYTILCINHREGLWYSVRHISVVYLNACNHGGPQLYMGNMTVNQFDHSAELVQQIAFLFISQNSM